MPMSVRLWSTAATLVLIAGCRPVGQINSSEPAAASTPADGPDRPKPADKRPFVHQAGADLSGYYVPVRPARFGRYQLNHLYVGGAEAFAAWEAGRRDPTRAPVLLVFDDTASAASRDGLGAPAYAVHIQVQPSSYRVDKDSLRFSGRSTAIGEIEFIAKVDGRALKAARADQPDASPDTLSGTLKIAGKTLENMTLSWFSGD
jgi:hypothetical protein